MKIPLFAKTCNQGTMMEIWSNKTRTISDLPFKPYLYSTSPRPEIPCCVTKENVKFISDIKEHPVYKYHFNSVKEIPNFRNNESMECDIPFIQRTAIDKPNFFLDYPNTSPLKIMYLDIEVYTTGKFPKPEINKIISIGFAVNNEKPEVINIKDKYEDDKEILKVFLQRLKEINPDVIVTFNGNYFDIPYIIERLYIHNIPSYAFTRSPEANECWFLDDNNKKKIYIIGRVMFDIFDEAKIDQTLFGIASRKMKDIAQWFNIDKKIKNQKELENYEIITEDVSNTEPLIGTPSLIAYQISDVLITRELCNIYLPNIITLSEMMQLPLNITARRTASTIATIYYARELKKKNIISDLPNYKRFPQIFGTPTIIIKRGREESTFTGGTSFQGATVLINKEYQGIVIKNINKVDYSGLYPSIICNFKLSPESISLIEEKPFIDETFILNNFGDYYELEFSDIKIHKNLKIKVMTKEGFLPKEIQNFMNEREIIKTLMSNETDINTITILNSRSWCYKILGNSSYGVNGSGFYKYGNVLVAITITAIGRYLIKFVINKLQNKHIEIDTDGAYVADKIDAIKLSQELNDFIKEKIGFTTNFKLEKDIYKSGFFLKMKNYILINEKGKLIKHGVSLKASSKNLIFAYTLDKIARILLEEPEKLESTAIECYNSINTASIKQFIQRTQINRPLNQYSSQPSAGKKGCLQVQVGKQSESFHESNTTVGDSISYVKGHYGYKIRENVKSTDDIDKEYYRKQVLSVFKKFKLDDIAWKAKNQKQNLLSKFF
jgi:DNA polymerase, archaea type